MGVRARSLRRTRAADQGHAHLEDGLRAERAAVAHAAATLEARPLQLRDRRRAAAAAEGGRKHERVLPDIM